ncbi:hypothetical protein CPC08DRAFT_402235 [Agrocybe pediades]|nr:hypothetical protein CPC08DRAFT_402235 [Agrocybe pediades]
MTLHFLLSCATPAQASRYSIYATIFTLSWTTKTNGLPSTQVCAKQRSILLLISLENSFTQSMNSFLTSTTRQCNRSGRTSRPQTAQGRITHRDGYRNSVCRISSNSFHEHDAP